MQPSTTCLYIYIIYIIYISLSESTFTNEVWSAKAVAMSCPSLSTCSDFTGCPSTVTRPAAMEASQVLRSSYRCPPWWGTEKQPTKKHCNGSCGNIRMVMDGSVLGLPHYADGNAWTFETCWNQKHHTGVKGLGKGATEQQSPVLVVVPRKRNKFARANLPQGSVSRNFALKSRS